MTNAEPQVLEPAAPATVAAPVEAPKGPVPGLTITRRGDTVFEPAAPAPDPTPAPAPALPGNPAPAAPVANPTPTDPAPVVAPAPAEPVKAKDPVSIMEPGAPAVPGIPTPDDEIEFFPYAAEQTGGEIASAEDVLRMYQEKKALEKQLAERPKIEFPNDQAKWLYEQALKFPGQERSAFKNALQVLSLDLTKMSDKEKQFEAFAFKHKDFTREEARKYFDAKYEKAYGDDILTTDVIAQFEHKSQTREAEEALAKMQDEFSKLETSKPAAPADQIPKMTPEEIAGIKKDVSTVLSKFGGVRYQHFENDPDSSVSIPLDKADLQKMEDYLVSPGNLFTDLQKECTDANGQFSMQKLALKMFQILHIDKIREQEYNSGIKYGELKAIMKVKNTSNPKDPAAPVPDAAPTTFEGSWLAAEKAKGLKTVR